MLRAPLPRRSEVWLRIAVGVAAVLLLVVSVSLGASLYGGLLLLLFVGVVVHAAAAPLALTRPGLAAPLSVAGALLIMVCAHGGSGPWPWAVTTMITQALVLGLLGYRATWVLGGVTLLLVVVLSGLIAPLIGSTRHPQAVAVDLVVFASIGAAALAAGVLAREWQSIRRQLARERHTTEAERARRQVAEEKTRIAREMHDVVAHSMSIITVQATSAPIRHPGVDVETRREFEEIAALSRRAVAEMRSLLTVLRDPDAPVARTPQPKLSGIAELVMQSQHSGLSVQLIGAEVLIDAAVDEAVGLNAYRIVQEALSNVIRHTLGADVVVRVSRDGGLDLVVSNTAGTGQAVSTTRLGADAVAGSGLLGMRERVASVGGTLAFGPTGDGGYEVHATLPLRPTETRAGA